jgi:hypothetical protein
MTHESNTDPLFHRIWPTIVVAGGLGLSAVWVSLLGYGVASLIMRAL